MANNLAQVLRTDIRVSITVLKHTTFRAWAGKGVRRRRQLELTDTLLEDFGKQLAAPYEFRSPDGTPAQIEDLSQLVTECFLSFDDVMVELAVGKDQDERHQAVRQMAEVIASAIENRWTVIKRPPRLSHSIGLGLNKGDAL